jgi:hypothetical protein
VRKLGGSIEIVAKEHGTVTSTLERAKRVERF